MRDFEGRFTGFGLVFSHEDDTVNSETQPLGELKLMLRRKGLSVLDQNFFHGGAIESGRALRPSENEAAGRRRFHSRGTVGAGFSSGERSVRPSTRRCQHGLASGPKRAPLERASAAWHICRLQTCSHRRKGVTTAGLLPSFGKSNPPGVGPRPGDYFSGNQDTTLPVSFATSQLDAIP